MDLFKQVADSVSSALGAMTRDDEVKTWLQEMSDAAKREEDWRKEGEEVVKLFEQEGSADANNLSDFNILYANVETLSPAVYNNPPRPVVKRRIDKENPVGMAAAQVIKAVLTYLTDSGDRDEQPFDELMKVTVQEALTPGRGAACFYYSSEVEDEAGYASVDEETVCGCAIPWNRFLHGYAKHWHQVPWIAYEYFMTREECVKQFGPEKGKSIKLTHESSSSDDKDKGSKQPADANGVKFAHLYRIQDKTSKKIIWVSEGYKSIIDSKDDPLKLDGFFDCPKPIMFFQRVSSLKPQTLYKLYQQQAEELDLATRRIKGILRALKVRGMYDSTIDGMEQLMASPENTLLPASNVAALAQGQTLEKAVWFFPLETLVVTLQQLYAARKEIIATIYQITGIADIMRGSTQASETLGAQEIKQQWGTMRLKRMQKEVQRFSRDCYRMQAELACKHFSLDTLINMTGMKFPRQAEQQQAMMVLDQVKQQVAMMQAQQQQPDPGLKQKAQQAQEVLSKPSWEKIHEFLRSDSIRNYVIDIETNSTIDIEATEDKQELAEMMNSMAQLLNGVFPMVEQGVLPFEAAKALCLSVIGKFRLGDEVEEVFRAMQAPQPKPDPATMKVQADIKRDQNKAQLDQQKEMQKAQLEQQRAQEELNMERQIKQMEMTFQKAELDFKMRELAMREEAANAKHQRDMQMIVMKATMPPAAPASHAQ